MFVDVATIHIAAGKGGDGCVSTRREKYVPRGGPDGGNGGRGGSIYLEAAADSSTLLDFRYRPKYSAPNGQPGSGQRRSGAAGEDVIIPVPCGTTVIRVEDETVLGDLVTHGDRLLVAEGGRGGVGNWVFRSARDQTPQRSKPGLPGAELEIRLELKLIADIGLVGAPNAGKSTLLSVLTAARPKIAAYPFTTLEPNLGIVNLGDYVGCTLADIPGLIEGAAQGRGLGHEFLRHVERTRNLLLMVDAAEPDAAETCAALRDELDDYGHGLNRRPFAVVLTKADLLDEDALATVVRDVAAWAEENDAATTLVISAVTGAGLDELKRLLRRFQEQTLAAEREARESEALLDPRDPVVEPGAPIDPDSLADPNDPDDVDDRPPNS